MTNAELTAYINEAAGTSYETLDEIPTRILLVVLVSLYCAVHDIEVIRGGERL